MEICLTKTFNGFVPSDPKSQEWADKIKIGQEVHSDFKKARNSGFHRRYFALLTIAFDLWEPGEINSKYGKPEKSFDRFRADLQILAGSFHTEIRVDGTVRVESDSISFAAMSQEQFEDLYQRVLNVIMQKILPNTSKEEIEHMTEQFLMFA